MTNDEGPYDFHCEKWDQSSGYGHYIANVRAGRSYDRGNVTAEIKAHGFTIDGRAYTLIGVDRFMPNTRIHVGEWIGLCVKEPPPHMERNA